jgi:hypothetical protein
MGGLTMEQLQAARMILWRGHCSVHGRFSTEAVAAARAEIPGVRVIVHPECTHEVVQLADEVGSTEKIIATIAAAPAGTAWAVGTELNLVQRLAQMFPEQRIAFLEKNVCYCSTMNRIDLPHLVWALESLVDGRVVNPIRVEARVAAEAKVALDRMLALPGETSKDGTHAVFVPRWDGARCARVSQRGTRTGSQARATRPSRPMCGLWSAGTLSDSGGGPGGVPSPKGRPPRDSRPCGVAQPDRSGPAGTTPVGLMSRWTS